MKITKNNLFNKSVCVFIAIICLVACNQTDKADKKAVSNTIKNETTENNCFEDFKKRHNSKSDSIEDYYTKYADGRKSEIRTMLSYESINCELKQNPKDAVKINLMVVEWNINQGIAADENAAFANQDNNQMFGGDVESNRLLAPSAKKFIQNGQLFLSEHFAKLTKIETIPNRNVDEVSIDFVTNKGIFTIKENREKLNTEKTSLSALFKEAEKLKREIEKVTDRFSAK